jgi:hypothetical protein
MILKQKIFQQKQNTGIHSGRVLPSKQQQQQQQQLTHSGKYSSNVERPVFHMQPRSLLPRPV